MAGSEFRSIVQPRNYNLRKLSSIISNAKRRMERYERYNLFNKGIILNCIVFWNNILTCLGGWHFDYISLILVNSSGIWQHAQWSKHFNKWGDIAIWKYELQKFDYEHQDFVGILSLVYICLRYACTITVYSCWCMHSFVNYLVELLTTIAHRHTAGIFEPGFIRLNS